MKTPIEHLEEVSSEYLRLQAEMDELIKARNQAILEAYPEMTMTKIAEIVHLTVNSVSRIINSFRDLEWEAHLREVEQAHFAKVRAQLADPTVQEYLRAIEGQVYMRPLEAASKDPDQDSTSTR